MSKKSQQIMSEAVHQEILEQLETTTTTEVEVHPVLLIESTAPTQPEEVPTFSTKSAAIRYHSSKGLTTGQIAKLMNIRYQHVRNVLITPVAKPTV